MDDLSSLDYALRQTEQDYEGLVDTADKVTDAEEVPELRSPPSPEELDQLDGIAAEGVHSAANGQRVTEPQAKPDASGDRPQPSRSNSDGMRSRTTEVSSSSKMVPKLDTSPVDFLGLRTELHNWFATFPNLNEFLHDIDGESCLYMALGEFRTARTRDDLEQRILEWALERAQTVVDTTWWPLEEPDELSLVFVALAASSTVQVGAEFVTGVIRQIASLRWKSQDASELLAQLLLILRLALLRALGDGTALAAAEERAWIASGLDPMDESKHAASPMEYEAFLNAVTARFPLCIPPDAPEYPHRYHESSVHENAVAQMPLSGPLNSFIPYVPESIREACELYKSRVRATPALLQLWAEQERLHKDELGASDNEPSTQIAKERDTCDDIYKQCIGISKSFIRVVVEYVMNQCQLAPHPAVHAALVVLDRLLKWFRVSHVLKYEYFAALLFDCQFHLVAHRYCTSHQDVLETLIKIDEAPPTRDFWVQAKPIDVTYEEFGIRPPRPQRHQHQKSMHTDPTQGIVVERYNRVNYEVFVHLMAVVRSIVTDHPQRIMILAELPADAFKPLLAVYNRELWTEVLGLLKLEVPFNGKRWRYLNMEVISAIYLHCPSKLDDDWLAGTDTPAEMRQAPAKEQSLRALIEFYNMRTTS